MLRLEEDIYPSGEIYAKFYIGSNLIGTAKKMPDGWLPFNKRKVLNAELAAKTMIDSMANKAKKDAMHAAKLLDALRLYCGGRLPSKNE